MAYYPGYYYVLPTYTEDIWREERLPGFQEVVLGANCQPDRGRIYVMYHGTTLDAAVKIMQTGFKQSEDGMLGRGVYVSRDRYKALRYPLYDKTYQVVLKLRVNVGKVLINCQGHPMQKTWHDNGYDTAWVPGADSDMVENGLEEDCVWDPKRIKVVGIEYMSLAASPWFQWLQWLQWHLTTRSL